VSDQIPQPSVSSPAPTVADALRTAREGRGESLLQAAETTRISLKYLQALESDAPPDAYPGPMYARFFLRDYARHLGLDAERLVEVFAARHGGLQHVLSADEFPDVTPGKRTSRNLGLAEQQPESHSATVLTSSSSRGNRIFTPSFSGLRRTLRVPTKAPVAIRPSQSRGRPHGNTVATVAAVVAAVALLAVVIPALRNRGHPVTAPSPKPSPPQLTLPRGGTTILPAYRVVAFYGAARTNALGILGIGPAPAMEKLLKQAAPYARFGRPILPAFELIATVASANPGDDGKYRLRSSDPIVGGYLDAAREGKMLLVLDIQPGRANFLTEAKVYQKYLEQPDVGLALDPEWHVGPGEVPGKQIGSVTAAEVNEVTDYLADLVRRHHLPQKLVVLHQFTADMIKDKKKIRKHPELALTLDVDGYGGQANKVSKYTAFTGGFERRFFHGIKLYYQRDVDLLSPTLVMQLLSPEPDFIVYQ
jgi:hypothetical protein